jgi:hypothetical protein
MKLATASLYSKTSLATAAKSIFILATATKPF